MGIDYYTCGICEQALTMYSFNQCKSCYERLNRKIEQYCCKKCEHKEYHYVMVCNNCEGLHFDRNIEYYVDNYFSLHLDISLCDRCFKFSKKYMDSEDKEDVSNFVYQIFKEHYENFKDEIKEYILSKKEDEENAEYTDNE